MVLRSVQRNRSVYSESGLSGKTRSAYRLRCSHDFFGIHRCALCAKLPNAELIWHGRLLSREFNAAGNVD